MTIASQLDTHAPRLKKFAIRLTSNQADADDLLQDTFLRALEKEHLYEERKGSNLYSWLSKIMYNLFASRFNRKKKFEYASDPEDVLKNTAVDAAQDTKLELKQTKKFVSQLSAKYKDVILFVCFYEMPYEQASQHLKIPVGTIRSRLSRARAQINEKMMAA